jgi:hypothetical protein
MIKLIFQQRSEGTIETMAEIFNKTIVDKTKLTEGIGGTIMNAYPLPWCGTPNACYKTIRHNITLQRGQVNIIPDG